MLKVQWRGYNVQIDGTVHLSWNCKKVNETTRKQDKLPPSKALAKVWSMQRCYRARARRTWRLDDNVRRVLLTPYGAQRCTFTEYGDLSAPARPMILGASGQRALPVLGREGAVRGHKGISGITLRGTNWRVNCSQSGL